MTTTTTEKEKAVNYGFPSHEVSPKKKDKKWCLQYIKAFHKEYTTGAGKILRWANEDYSTWRLYAAGNQPIDQYKELLGVRKRKGKRDPSWLNLDWNILSILPRIKDVVKNKILNQPYEIFLRPIDQVSVTKERQRRAEIVEYMANLGFLKEATQDMPFEPASPFEPGEPTPQNSKEVDLYLTMFPKNRHAMEMMDQINLAMASNDWEQIREEIVDDNFDVGIGGTKVYIDNIGVIRMRRCETDRMITNACRKRDFSDLIRVGEYVDMTISQLRQAVPKGTFTDKEYAQMASKVSGTRYVADAASIAYFNDKNCYPWDHERMTVLDAEWFSSDDTATIVEKNFNGEIKIIEKDDPHWLQQKGITDEEYVRFQKESRGSERELIRDSVNNVYRGCWIVGTEFMYNYGLQSNMIRALSSIGDCELGYTLYTLNFDSIVRRVMPACDDIQKNWLLYQHYTAQAKPPGIAIERRAISQVTIGSGKNTILLGTEDILKQYAETGSYVYVGTDQNGKPYPYDPIKELKGGVSEQAGKCLQNILTNIELIRNITGLNEFTDATDPDPRANKDIVRGATNNTNNALGTMVHAYTSIYRRTAKKICMLVPDAEMMGFNAGKVNALGDQTHSWFKMNADKALIDWSIVVELGITSELRERLALYVQQSLKSAANPGGLLPEDAWIIENEKNIHRAYLILSQKRRQREQEDFERQQALLEKQSQGQTQTAVALEQMKQQTIMMQLQATEREAYIKAQGSIAVEERKAFLQAMIIKMQSGEELKGREAELYASLVETQLKIAGQIKVAQIGVEGQIRVEKMKPKPTASSKK